MLDVNGALPEDAEIFLVMWDDRRVPVSLRDIKGSSLSALGTRGGMDIQGSIPELTCAYMRS